MAISVSSIKKPVEKIIEAIKSLQGVSTESKSGNEALINSLQEMEDAYVDTQSSNMPNYEEIIPESTNAIMKTYDEKTDEELLEEAKQSLMPSYTEKVNSLNESTDEKVADLQTKLSSEELDSNADMAESEEDFVEDTTSATNLAVNNGISNSSIVTNMKESILNEYRSEIETITNEYTVLSNSIKEEIELLYQSKENSLLEYDLTQAVEIEKELATLKSAQQSAIASINKYNEQLIEAETEYQSTRTAEIASLQEEWRNTQSEQLEYEQINGYSGDNLVEMDNRYDMAKEFYFSITKSDASKLIEENAESLKNSLGASYYAKLVEENSNR
jgi:hypothetical protein